MNEYTHLFLKHKILHKICMYVVNGSPQQSSTCLPPTEGH